VTPTLKVHLLEVDGRPMLVAESSGHVSLGWPPGAPDHRTS